MADRAYNDGRMRTMYNDEKDERKENKERGRERTRKKKNARKYGTQKIEKLPVPPHPFQEQETSPLTY